MDGNGARPVQHELDGLAVHEIGHGDPVLLVPYWHAFTTSPMAEGPLAEMLVSIGRRVITFDPPGAYGSSRRPTMEVAEMVGCALEALDAVGVAGSVDVVGHSAGAYCAAVLACEHSERVGRLALVSPTGVGDPSKLRALPWGPLDSRFWRFYRLAIPVYGGRASAAQHKAVYDLLVPALHARSSKCPGLTLAPGAGDAPAPPRAAMIRDVPPLKRRELNEIGCPVLVASGTCDPIVPLPLAEKVVAWLPDARLEVLEGCGHYPQHEMPKDLARALSGFLA